MTNSFLKEDERDSSGDEAVVRGRLPLGSPEIPTFAKPVGSPVFRYEYQNVPLHLMDPYVGYYSSGMGRPGGPHEGHDDYFDPTDSRAFMEDSSLRIKVASNSVAQDSFSVAAHSQSAIMSMNSPSSQMVMSKSMMELEDLLSKLNPMAEEFTPPSDSAKANSQSGSNGAEQTSDDEARKAKSGKKSPREASRGARTHREESVKRTVYVADIDQQVTEEQLARLFLTCGQVVDCRVCGDPNSVLRFAFVEFTDEHGAKRALDLAGTVIGYYPLRVLPSKTAIVPVNPTFLPRSSDERELCARTVYCANIDRKITQADVKLFFESLCGEVSRLRLLGDNSHSTRIAFVEFIVPESAVAALSCSGAILGSMPIRVSPSKTPVRTRGPRAGNY